MTCCEECLWTMMAEEGGGGRVGNIPIEGRIVTIMESGV